MPTFGNKVHIPVVHLVFTSFYTNHKDHKSVGKVAIVIMPYSPNHSPAHVANKSEPNQKLKINLWWPNVCKTENTGSSSMPTFDQFQMAKRKERAVLRKNELLLFQQV